MEHIGVAIEVLKKEIKRLEHELKHGHHLSAHEEEMTGKIQKLKRAIADIHGTFDTDF